MFDSSVILPKSDRKPLLDETSSIKSIIFGGPDNIYGRHGMSLAEMLLTSPLQPLERIWWNLTGSNYSTYSTKYVF